jgi:hypothetical protein
VINVHANARKAVFPTAILFKFLKKGNSRRGAEYKKVISIENKSQNLRRSTWRKQKPAVINPEIINTTWMTLNWRPQFDLGELLSIFRLSKL